MISEIYTVCSQNCFGLMLVCTFHVPTVDVTTWPNPTFTPKPNPKSSSTFLKFFWDFYHISLWGLFCCCPSNCFHLSGTGALPTLHVPIFTSTLPLWKPPFQVSFLQALSHFRSHQKQCDFLYGFFFLCLLIALTLFVSKPKYNFLIY